MRGKESVGGGSTFRRGYSVNPLERQYRSEIHQLLRDITALLPRYQMCVDGTQYASERNKLTVLTACYNDTSLDTPDLETLLQSLRSQYSVLTAVLNKSRSTARSKHSG
jgi:hypothetical protein